MSVVLLALAVSSAGAARTLAPLRGQLEPGHGSLAAGLPGSTHVAEGAAALPAPSVLEVGGRPAARSASVAHASPTDNVTDEEPKAPPASESSSEKYDIDGRSTVFGFTRRLLGIALLAYSVYLWVWWCPMLLYRERQKFLQENFAGRTFEQYLTYRFNYWMDSEGVVALLTLLLMGTLSLLTFCGFLFAITHRVSPVTGFWVCFVWASAASIDPKSSAITGAVGVLSTLGGLLLLAILLTAIADCFNRRVEAMRAGRDPVVEGGHIVVLGHSANTKVILEEIAKCEEDGAPRTVVVLAPQPKSQVENEIASMNTETGDLKVVVRSGKPYVRADLWKAGADVASRIILPEDPSVSKDESDAATCGTLLALKSQGEAGWPMNGHIAVQCCVAANVGFMSRLYEDKACVLNGERLGRVMVQSVRDQGLCQIFNQLIGFDGDEFYAGRAADLGVVGLPFRELPFWFPLTTPVGLISGDGQFVLNPEKSHEVAAEDVVIVLADDDDSLVPAGREPFFDYPAWARNRPAATFMESNPNDKERLKALICNFTERGFALSILFALDEMSAPGSEVEIFTTLPEETVRSVLEDAQQRKERTLENVQVTNIYVTPSESMTAAFRLQVLPLETYDNIYVLADTSKGNDKADVRTVAMILQMKSILSSRGYSKEFQPLVEICSDAAANQLLQLGVDDCINTSEMLARALTMVAISQTAHGVFGDLLAANGNTLDVMDVADYMAEGEEVPEELNFAELSAIVCRAAHQIAIGWSEGSGGAVEWVLNPKDKLASRPWTAEDKVVVIRQGPGEGGSMPSRDEPHRLIRTVSTAPTLKRLTGTKCFS